MYWSKVWGALPPPLGKKWGGGGGGAICASCCLPPAPASSLPASQPAPASSLPASLGKVSPQAFPPPLQCDLLRFLALR